jgi:hypothetical protein
MQNSSPRIETLVREFTAALVDAVEAEAKKRIADAVSSTFGLSAPVAAPDARTTAAPARPRKTDAAVGARRKLQGQYMGALRRLGPANRTRVQKVAREQGVAAAVKLASSLL